jgi:hypothetical protein
MEISLMSYCVLIVLTACSENLVVRHFVKKKLSGIRQTPLRGSIRTGYVF